MNGSAQNCGHAQIDFFKSFRLPHCAALRT
jgi:hypothetical protein